MYRTIKYTLIDGVTITTEAPVCFPQTLNPCMDFMQAVSVLEAGGEVRRASVFTARIRIAAPLNPVAVGAHLYLPLVNTG